jgi:cation diffusion facilitator family transporter
VQRSPGRVNYGLAASCGGVYVNGVPPNLPPHHTLAQQRAQAGARLVLRGIGLNALLAALKFAGGLLGNTYALIADGVESLLDIVSSVLVWAGFRVAAQPPDEDHPYGHGKAEPLAALAVAFFVLGAAGWIAWHAVREIISPQGAPAWWTLLLLAVVIAAKAWFSGRMAKLGRAVGSTALGAEALHHWSDALTSAAAFIGITIALVGGPGYEAADDWAALFACLIIAVNGVNIFKRAVGDVMDVAVTPALAQEVRALALGVPGVAALVDGNLTVRAGHDIAHAVKDALLASVPHAITDVAVHIEPMDS